MRVSKLGVVAAACGLVLGACVDAEEETLSEDSAAVSARPGRYLVVFMSETAPADAGARINKAGGKTKKLVGNIGVASFDGTAAAAAKLRTDPTVLSVGVERVTNALPEIREEYRRRNPPIGQPTPTDDLYGYQWDIRRIGAPAVWQRSQSGARSRVAVLDTGVMTTHPDLVGQVCGEKRFTYCTTTSSWPSPAYPAYDTLIDFDAYPAWDPEVDPCTPVTLAFQAHGTHVSGTIAGKIGGGSIVGVAPNACVGAYKVFDRYRYTDNGTVVDDVGAFDGPLFAAIVDATDSGYGVISMSLGGVIDLDDPEQMATWQAWKRVTNYANRKGAVIIAAAGNESLDLSGSLANIPSDLPHVVSVAATGASLANSGSAEVPTFNAVPNSDVLAFYSNYGKPVDISAPGGDCGPGYAGTCDFQNLILSSYIFETDNELPGVPAGSGGYAWFAGTDGDAASSRLSLHRSARCTRAGIRQGSSAPGTRHRTSARTTCSARACSTPTVAFAEISALALLLRRARARTRDWSRVDRRSWWAPCPGTT